MNMSLLLGLLAGLSMAGTTAGAAQTIEKGKALGITATGIAEADRAIMANTYPVSNDGSVNLPFVGKVPAVGLTGEELGRVLETVFQEKGIYRGVRFKVDLELGRRIFDIDPVETVAVGGQVKMPRPVPIGSGLTIYQAIQNAGGIKELGYAKRVRLCRNGKSWIYDLGDEALGKIPLQKNDTIEVMGKSDKDPE